MGFFRATLTLALAMITLSLSSCQWPINDVGYLPPCLCVSTAEGFATCMLFLQNEATMIGFPGSCPTGATPCRKHFSFFYGYQPTSWGEDVARDFGIICRTRPVGSYAGHSEKRLTNNHNWCKAANNAEQRRMQSNVWCRAKCIVLSASVVTAFVKAFW